MKHVHCSKIQEIKIEKNIGRFFVNEWILQMASKNCVPAVHININNLEFFANFEVRIIWNSKSK